MPPQKNTTRKQQAAAKAKAIAPPRPVPTMETLPQFAHDTIASYFPDGDKDEKRYRLALISRAMREFYGGTLTALELRWNPSYCVEALVSLLQRQHALKTVRVNNPKAIHALIVLLARGCLKRVRELTVSFHCRDSSTTLEHIRTLAGVLRVPGALEALKVLRLSAEAWEDGMLPELARALGSGAAPSLRLLDVGSGLSSHANAEALAAMLEARARLPACCGLGELKASNFMDTTIPEATRTRLLRALLPSVTELGTLWWMPEYEASFVEVGAPCLKKATMRAHGEDAEFPSAQVWEAMPELEGLMLQVYGDVASVQPVISALERGVAFQRLQMLTCTSLQIPVDEWGRLLSALAGASCASQLTSLDFDVCAWCRGPMAVLSKWLGQDAFPKLETLSLCFNYDLKDDGVVNLVRGLLAAPRTRLMELLLSGVDMGDGGMGALASLVRAGCFERLKSLSVAGHSKVTDEGVCSFAQVVAATGKLDLPELSKFRGGGLHPSVTRRGLGALAAALIYNCPRLTSLDLTSYTRDGEPLECLDKATIEGIVIGAGCRHRLEVKV